MNNERVLTGRLSTDERTIYVTRVQDDGGGLYVNQRFDRALLDSPWVTGPIFYDGDGLHTPLTPSNDGTGLYFSYFDDSVYAIFFARFGTNGTLDSPSPIEGVPPSSLGTVAPYPSADDKTLYFSHAPAGQTYDLFEADRISNTQIANPRPLTTLNTPAIEANPIPSADGLTLSWSSSFERTNIGFRMASRATPQGDFGASTTIPSLSSYDDDKTGLSGYLIGISRDNCRFYSVSNIGSLVTYRIYVASRKP